MFELSVRENISSAHFLEGHEGKCKHLHGHTWKVEVTICSDHLDVIGRVVDFAVFKEKIKEFLSSLDHACLNDLENFKDVNPTTENISKYIYTEIKEIIKPLELKKVQVWESDSSSIVYYE
jgi:6-pyruvoyltetrahydropterin/6-carboxytetrahydropterin synthase